MSEKLAVSPLMSCPLSRSGSLKAAVVPNCPSPASRSEFPITDAKGTGGSPTAVLVKDVPSFHAPAPGTAPFAYANDWLLTAG